MEAPQVSSNFSHSCGSLDLWFLHSPLPHELRGLTDLGNAIVSLLGALPSNHQDHHHHLVLHHRRSSSQPPLITWWEQPQCLLSFLPCFLTASPSVVCRRIFECHLVAPPLCVGGCCPVFCGGVVELHRRCTNEAAVLTVGFRCVLLVQIRHTSDAL
jgi:hypothetical protein